MAFVAAACVAGAEKTCAQGGGDPLSRLRERFPGVRTREAGGERVRQVFGVPMTAGQTPREAAEGFVGEFAPIFGGEGIDLREVWVRDPGRGKTFFAYQQYIDDLPVYGSIARVMVLNEPSPRVAYAAAKVAPHPAEPLPQALLTPSQAIGAAMEDRRAEGLSVWDEPSQAVWCGEEEGLNEVVGIVWLCPGSVPRQRLLFVVDARTGEVYAAIDQILDAAPSATTTTASSSRAGAETPRIASLAESGTAMPAAEEPAERGDTTTVEITGTVTGTVISQSGGSQWKPFWGDGTNDCDPSLVEQLLPNVLVHALDSGAGVLDSVFTDEDGEYTLTVPASTEVTVRASLEAPFWFVKDCQGDSSPGCEDGEILTVEEDEVVGPTEVELEFALPNTEPERQFSLAQTNAHFIVSQVFTHYQSFAVIPVEPLFPFEVYVNRPGVCGAFYGQWGSEPTFYVEFRAAGSICPNWAYSTIVAHEFGHLLHIMLGIQGGVFTEGFADVASILFFNTSGFGENAQGCSTVLRSFTNPGEEYPQCNNLPYTQALVFGGVWWDIRDNTSIGTTRTLFADWALLTIGADAPYTCISTPYAQAIGPGTMIEVLTADDNDANLSNGTPNGTAICMAFCENNIPIPDEATEGCELEACPESGGGWCRADCDPSTGPGVLDVFDTLCFLSHFHAGEPASCNWDESSGPDVCDILDFLAFQKGFALGCP